MILSCPCSNISLPDIVEDTSFKSPASSFGVVGVCESDVVIKYSQLATIQTKPNWNVYCCKICGPVLAYSPSTGRVVFHSTGITPTNTDNFDDPLLSVFSLRLPSSIANSQFDHETAASNVFSSIGDVEPQQLEYALSMQVAKFIDNETIEMQKRIDKFIAQEREKLTSLTARIKSVSSLLSNLAITSLTSSSESKFISEVVFQSDNLLPSSTDSFDSPTPVPTPILQPKHDFPEESAGKAKKSSKEKSSTTKLCQFEEPGLLERGNDLGDLDSDDDFTETTELPVPLPVVVEAELSNPDCKPIAVSDTPDFYVPESVPVPVRGGLGVSNSTKVDSADLDDEGARSVAGYRRMSMSILSKE
ncbi:hypothetical protein GEMRC1_008226 [Eukaryota sp. GEM-RC1]